MLIHEKFNQFEDFKDTAIFYNEDNFIDKLNELTSDKSILERLESALKSSPIWNKDQIRANYINMLRS
jgi:hypothetical protein